MLFYERHQLILQQRFDMILVCVGLKRITNICIFFFSWLCSKTDTALSCMLKRLRSVSHPQAVRENTNALLKCCSVSKMPRWKLSADMTVCHIRRMSSCPLYLCLSKILHGLSSSITLMYKSIHFCHFSYSVSGLKQPQTLSINQQLLLNKSTIHSFVLFFLNAQ